MKKDCRFKFSGSYCANRRIKGERCFDHDGCLHYSPPFDSAPMGIGDSPPAAPEVEHNACGVYCAKTQKFITDYAGDDDAQ